MNTPLAERLTPGQRAGLAILAARVGKETWTSSRNDPPFLASATAISLVRLGLARWVRSKHYGEVALTEKGAAIASALRRNADG